MKFVKDNRIYEAPQTSMMQVELEGNVCNSSPGLQQTEQGKTSNQEGNNDFNFATSDDWD